MTDSQKDAISNFITALNAIMTGEAVSQKIKPYFLHFITLSDDNDESGLKPVLAFAHGKDPENSSEVTLDPLSSYNTAGIEAILAGKISDDISNMFKDNVIFKTLTALKDTAAFQTINLKPDDFNTNKEFNFDSLPKNIGDLDESLTLIGKQKILAYAKEQNIDTTVGGSRRRHRKHKRKHNTKRRARK